MKVLSIKDDQVAIYEKPVSGSKYGPRTDPLEHLGLLRFHSDFQYLSSFDIADVTVSHDQVDGVTGSGQTGAPTAGGSATGATQAIANGQIAQASHTLFEHDYGYEPFHMVLYNGEIVSGATVVQSASGGRARRVASYATDSIIGLRETAVSSADDLASISRSYRVIVFRDIAADPAKPLFHVRLSDGIIVLGRGKITHEMKTLRRAADEEEAVFYVPVTPTVDIRNGAVRSVSPVGGVTDSGLYSGTLFTIDAIRVTYDGYEV